MERRRSSSELPKKSSTTEKAMKDLATAAATAAMDEDGDVDDDDEVAPCFSEDEKKRRLSPSSGPASVRRALGGGGSGTAPSQPCCQAEKCTADLTEAKRYHRRHKVCEAHSKAAVVVVAGLRQRFCQQCSRFHELSEFDDTKRSCRRRLAGHNERRRKSSAETAQGEGSSRCRHPDQDGRIQMSLPGSSTYKHFQIR